MTPQESEAPSGPASVWGSASASAGASSVSYSTSRWSTGMVPGLAAKVVTWPSYSVSGASR